MLRCLGKESVNTNKSFFNTTQVESKLKSYLDLELTKTTECGTYKKTVVLFPGYEYTLYYYDMENSSKKSQTGLIMDIFCDCCSDAYVLFQYLPESENTEINETNPLNCNCILSPNAKNKYVNLVTVQIPAQNIYDIEYGAGNPINNENDNDCRGGWTTVLLGISATMIKAVSLNLKLIDDQCENAAKDITMNIGNAYTVAFCNPTDRTVYELDGRLVSIKEIKKLTNNPTDTTVRCNCKEEVGIAGSLYTSSGDTTDRDSFLSCCNCTDKYQDVELIFDTSEFTDGSLETVMLSWMRDCTLIKEYNDTDDNKDDDDNKCNCDCNCCSKEINILNADDEFLGTINMIKMTITFKDANGNDQIISMNKAIEKLIEDTKDPIEPDPDIPVDPDDPNKNKPSVGEGEVIPGDDDW